MKKNSEEAILAFKESSKKALNEYLSNNGKIDKLPSVKDQKKTIPVNSSKSKTPHLMTLVEAGELYGEKSVIKGRKKKTPNMEGIDKNKIPDSLHYLWDKLGKNKI